MVGKFLGVLLTILISLGGAHPALGARPKKDCKFLLLEGGRLISIQVPETKLTLETFEQRSFSNAGVFTPLETLKVSKNLLRSGYADTPEAFTNALSRAGKTVAGRYLLQFTIRLAKAVGRSHGIDAEDSEDIAAIVFTSLLNGRHTYIDGTPLPSQTVSKVMLLQEMQYSLLPSLQHLDALGDDSLIALRFADGLLSLLNYLQGVEIRDIWEENMLHLLDKLQLYSGYTATNLTSYSHQLNLYHGRASYVISEWEATVDWDSDRHPAIPLANQSAAFSGLASYFSQAEYHDAQPLGGMIGLSPKEAKTISLEAVRFLVELEDYLKLVRGAATVKRGPSEYNPPRREPAHSDSSWRWN